MKGGESNVKSMFNLPDAEREVMEKLWDQTEPIKQSALLAIFEAEERGWKRQTLNTFLARLEEKGLVVREKRMVHAVYSRDKYNCMQMKKAIDHMYGGKLCNFVASLARESGVDEAGVEVLEKVLENY